MRTLYLSASPAQRRAVFIFSIVAAVLITILLNMIGQPLITTAAPAGIVSFELAGTNAHAQLIIASWDTRARQFAAFSLGFDYLYMLAYAGAISLGCLLAGLVLGERGWPLASLGALLAIGLWLAAGFDALENLALSMILLGGATAEFWPALARLCALIKFGLIILGMLYLFYGLVGRLAPKESD